MPAQTVSVEPDWANLRTWVLHVASCGPADLKRALAIADTMGREAPSLHEIAVACGAVEKD